MANRRDLFLFAPAPGQEAEAKSALIDWVSQLDHHEGFLGGAVLSECANELVPNAMVLVLDFESTESIKAFWANVRGVGTPVAADGDDRNPPDQGSAIYETEDGATDGSRSVELNFDRGGGRFARLFHAHCEVSFEHRGSHDKTHA